MALQAGIVTWMLTGDKQETAINIAMSCALITGHPPPRHGIAGGTASHQPTRYPARHGTPTAARYPTQQCALVTDAMPLILINGDSKAAVMRVVKNRRYPTRLGIVSRAA